MKHLLTILVFGFLTSSAQATDFTITVQSSQKQWKLKNGTTTVAVFDRDASGNTGYISVQRSRRLYGMINKLTNVFTFATIGSQIGIMNPKPKVYFTTLDCTGTAYGSDVSNFEFAGFARFDSKIKFLNTSVSSGLTSSSVQSSAQTDGTSSCDTDSGPPGVTPLYPFSDCTVGTCGFDETSTLTAVYE